MKNKRYTTQEVKQPNPDELVEIIQALDTQILMKIASNKSKTKWSLLQDHLK